MLCNFNKPAELIRSFALRTEGDLAHLPIAVKPPLRTVHRSYGPLGESKHLAFHICSSRNQSRKRDEMHLPPV